MLKTLFVVGFVAVPLGLAFLLILWRARWFILGVAAIALLLMLIWSGLRIAALWEESPGGITALLTGPSCSIAHDVPPRTGCV